MAPDSRIRSCDGTDMLTLAKETPVRLNQDNKRSFKIYDNFLANGRTQDIIPSLYSHGEGTTSRTKSVWCSDCMETTDQSFIMHKTRR
jgi:hypothetical protein